MCGQTAGGSATAERYGKYLLWLIMLLGLGFRLKYFGLHRFYIDEALYASWALRIYHKLDFLLNGAVGVDKPPLLFYLQALSYFLFGVSENAARIPNFLAGMGCIALLYLIGRDYFNKTTGLIAAFLAAVSPLMIGYSNTAFTDPLMLCLALTALYWAGRDAYFGSGLALGLAFGAKQFAALFIPLLLALIWVRNAAAGEKTIRKHLAEFGRGAGVVIAAVLFLSLFSNPALGLIFEQYAGQKQVGELFRADYLQRAAAWLRRSEVIFNSRTFDWLGAACFAALAAYYGTVFASARADRSRRLQESLILSFGIFYFAALVFINAKIFDRYLLILTPFAILAVAHALGLLLNRLGGIKNRRAALAGGAACVLALFVFGMRLPQGLEDTKYDSGGFFSENDGIEQVAWYFRNRAEPAPAVLINDHTGWLYGFYCDGCKIKIADFENADAARKAVAADPDAPWYAVLPGAGKAGGLGALADAGLSCREVYTAAGGGKEAKYFVFRLEKADR